ncbi:LuxR C-terminal-related transcriptional regulator [Dankookia sp. GCM10030260]|uniref:LuxR C-terminal-related transcriptional regulator n=1 Tax=Dankookia sp. GCM10030260 TaxID=3273390 RepID=UPI0036069ACD
MHGFGVPILAGNIIIVESRRLSREALHRLLQAVSFTVIGEGRTLADALTRVPAETTPDLIIYSFDRDAEVESELPQIREAKIQFKGVKSVVLTDCSRLDVLLKVFHAGIEAILSRDISSDVLQRTLELVLLGQQTFPPGLTRLLLEPTPAPTPAPEAIHIQLHNMAPLPEGRRSVMLSRREQQILRCLVDGLANKVIARQLEITEATVKVHIKALLRKTQMTNRTQAAIWALNHSLDSAPAALRVAE